MLHTTAALALTLGSTSFVANGIVTQRPAMPSIQMNSEARAKAAWLAKIDTPSWGPGAPKKRTSAMTVAGRVMPTGTVRESDDHSDPMARVALSAPPMARVPIATVKTNPAAASYDDHSNPSARIQRSATWSRVPIATSGR